jgi:hypothetical protein
MWYVVNLIFAQKPKNERRRVMCETCRVLLQASSASECYDRGLEWGKKHKHNGFHLLGIENILSLDEKRPSDGDEIGGHFYHAFDIWKKRKNIIPRKKDIPAIMWETHRNTPIGDLLSTQEQNNIIEIFEE